MSGVSLRLFEHIVYFTRLGQVQYSLPASILPAWFSHHRTFRDLAAGISRHDLQKLEGRGRIILDHGQKLLFADTQGAQFDVGAHA